MMPATPSARDHAVERGSVAMTHTHVFAGNPLDRADTRRRDRSWLEAAFRDPKSRVLPFANLNPLLESRAGVRLGWLRADRLARFELEEPPVFLGLAEGIAHFALDVSSLGDPVHELDLDDSLTFQDARAAAMALDGQDTGIVAQARSQVDWHRRHRYCSACGARTQADRGGHVRRCDACGAEHFPRTDPVAIMLVVDGERCLLGQGADRLARSGMYSALAGFIDQGESIEEAVRREVREEAGVRVGAVRYHSSQPWPFPSSLMIGCHGQALSTAIEIDTEEMADVSWFPRDEVVAALAGGHPRLKLPGPIAIAHHLIRAWAEDQVAFD
jgi:NAD+ diphosphatase